MSSFASLLYIVIPRYHYCIRITIHLLRYYDFPYSSYVLLFFILLRLPSLFFHIRPPHQHSPHAPHPHTPFIYPHSLFSRLSYRLWLLRSTFYLLCSLSHHPTLFSISALRYVLRRACPTRKHKKRPERPYWPMPPPAPATPNERPMPPRPASPGPPTSSRTT